jgi:hypothetical protein
MSKATKILVVVVVGILFILLGLYVYSLRLQSTGDVTTGIGKLPNIVKTIPLLQNIPSIESESIIAGYTITVVDSGVFLKELERNSVYKKTVREAFPLIDKVVMNPYYQKYGGSKINNIRLILDIDPQPSIINEFKYDKTKPIVSFRLNPKTIDPRTIEVHAGLHQLSYEKGEYDDIVLSREVYRTLMKGVLILGGIQNEADIVSRMKQIEGVLKVTDDSTTWPISVERK